MTHIWRRGNGEQHRSVLSIDQSLALLAIGIVYAHCQIYLKYLVNVSVSESIESLWPCFKDWICKSQRSVEEKAFCKWCQSEIQPNVAKLKDHAKTMKHSNLAKEKVSQKSVKTLFSLPTSVNQTRKRRELRLALICSYNTSLQTIDDFSTFLNDEFGQGTVRIKRTKCHALITNVLAPYFRAELRVILFILHSTIVS